MNTQAEKTTLPEFTWGLVNVRTGRIHSLADSREKARARKRETDRIVKLVADYNSKA